MTQIYWMFPESPPDLESQAGTFLSPREQSIYTTLHFPKRRTDWLLGRWAAKQLAHALPLYRALSWQAIEILPNPQGAPSLHISGRPAPNTVLSLSHSYGRVLCAISQTPGLQLGVDLEKIEARPAVFVEDYFTSHERHLIQTALLEQQPFFITLFWSLKEAMLKALGIGLRQDTRRVEVIQIQQEGGNWKRATVQSDALPSNRWTAFWQQRGEFILSLVTSLPEEHALPLSQLDLQTLFPVT
ncbi:MAG: 4'-phosphopantetheinyl transferase superfamily protein [Anaerolineales bacterium]|nr:4'-phosphopantetheinyl transferase superfamily protein [Anaerolineales bacterium]MCX7608718.1 4'-phosphopantetheinyl transferase superfamily protein [Anaerolineales bacterium]MDW8228091.1 4'-phosphopantetheinyl transferase superfamily protein [Anaerolineales bacterium]